jgi:Zn-dependent protease
LVALVKEALTALITLLLSISVHEYSHALAAFRLGDDTAARQGRLTLNPFAHADPIGTLLLPLLLVLTNQGMFGWGRPVPYVPNHLTRRFSLRAGEAIIAFAGPLANLVLAVLSTLALYAIQHTPIHQAAAHYSIVPVIRLLLKALLQLNLILFFFNLLPVPPLDGSKILAWLLGYRADRLLESLQSLGVFGLILAIVFGGYVIGPFVGFGMDVAERFILSR